MVQKQNVFTKPLLASAKKEHTLIFCLILDRDYINKREKDIYYTMSSKLENKNDVKGKSDIHINLLMTLRSRETSWVINHIFVKEEKKGSRYNNQIIRII
jgi:hypothetical protein